MKLLKTPLIAVTMILSSAQAATLVSFDFNNNAVDGTALDLSPTIVDPLVTSSDVTSPGFGFATTTATAFTSEAVGLADGTGDNINGAGAPANSQFFEFTVTAADPSITFSIDTLSFDIGRAANGAQDFAVRSSLTGTTNIVFQNQAIGTTLSNQSVDLNAVTSVDPLLFDDLTTITFQIVVDDRFSDNINFSGTFIDNLELEGVAIDSTAIPEPSSALLMALGGLACIGRRRRSQ